MTRDDIGGISELNSTHSGLPPTFTLAFCSVFHSPCSAIILVSAPLINSTPLCADCLVGNPDHTRCNAALCTLVLCARSGAHSALSAQ